VAECQAQSWVDAERGIARRENAAMARWAPDLEWRDDLHWRQGRRAFGWVGSAPDWAADRERPPGVEELLDGRRLKLKVVYPEAFPAVPAVLFPTDPDVPLMRRTLSTWHVNGDGSLCLMQAAGDWRLEDTAADLVRKASGWFIEYLLLEAVEIEKMTERGIFADTVLDPILGKFAR
jgi:hypothetical protein